ncbi:hypothetical protein Tco_1473611 [Tanacetum coccineum]
MEQYLTLTQGNQVPGMVRPEIGGNVNFEIKSQFMRELREDKFVGNKKDDAHKHVERILDIVSLFNISRVTHDAVMLRTFPITLTGAAKRWVDRLTPGLIWGCDRLVSESGYREPVMAALVISISSDVSVESVGSSFPRVILIDSISVEAPVAPEVGAATITSPAGVLELDTHSSSETDPSESSPPPISVAPIVSSFLCYDDSESNTKIPKRYVSHTPHDAMLTRWRSRVTSQSSSPTTSILEIPTAPILPAPSSIVAPSSEALTTRNSVRPSPSHRLALRYTSYHLDRFTSGSSSSHSSLDHSSSGHYIWALSLSEHTSPDTTIADSSTPPRFVHPPLARTSRCSEAYLH